MNQKHSVNDGEFNATDPFAVVGVAFKMPQEAVDERSLWEVLQNGRSLMTEWPADRCAVDSFLDPESKKPNTVCRASANLRTI